MKHTNKECGMAKHKLNHYFVITPEYEMTYGYWEPPEIGRDLVTIWADNPETAKILAIRSKELSHWVREQRSDDCNPFTGLEVENCKCEHGKCCCDQCKEECEECIEEAEKYWEENEKLHSRI